MKKYVKPTMNGQIFVGDEYVAVCGNQTSYKFKCNAGYHPGLWNDESGYLYLNDWTPSNCYYWDRWDEEYRLNNNSYTPCGEEHEADTDDVFVLGWFDTDSNPNNGKNHTQVYIWQEIENGYVVNHHATTDVRHIVSQINRS